MIQKILSFIYNVTTDPPSDDKAFKIGIDMMYRQHNGIKILMDNGDRYLVTVTKMEDNNG